MSVFYVTFLGACLWGLSGVCIQHLHEAYALDSLTITCVRSITASVLFLLDSVRALFC